MRQILVLIFSLIILSTVFATNAKVTITTADADLYLDYSITTTEYDLNIPLIDLQELIYLGSNKDINYALNKDYITITSKFSDKTIMIKYRSLPLTKNHIYLEKTIAFNKNPFDKLDIILYHDENKLDLLIPEVVISDYKAKWSFKKNDDVIIYFRLIDKSLDGKTIFAIIFAFIIIIFLIATIMLKKIKNRRIDKKTLETKYLTDFENNIIELLKKQDGLMQQTISEQLDIEKSHLSKLISKLERKNLIERKQIGKIKKVFLKD